RPFLYILRVTRQKLLRQPMTLDSGTRLSPYEVLFPIKTGEIKEMYQTRNTRLKRDVAIKALPASLATNADQVSRFERETRLLASLNHPHIAAIYGFEDAGSVPVLVLELVEGEGLDERVSQSPLPLGKTLKFAQQIANALDTT